MAAAFMMSPHYLTQAVAPAMKENHFGRIIHITSEVFTDGTPHFSAYVSAKGAQIGYLRSTAKELGSGRGNLVSRSRDRSVDRQIAAILLCAFEQLRNQLHHLGDQRSWLYLQEKSTTLVTPFGIDLSSG